MFFIIDCLKMSQQTMEKEIKQAEDAAFVSQIQDKQPSFKFGFVFYRNRVEALDELPVIGELNDSMQ